MTGSLLAVGFVSILAFEWQNPETLGSLTGGAKIWSAFFTAATPRTAGFNVLPTDGLAAPTSFLVMILMFIGASPASTGGGIKTTTFGTLMITVLSVIRGSKDVNLFERRIPFPLVNKALAIIIISLSLVVLVTLVLLITEDATFQEVLFEAISAFGTVGLSKGITPDLSEIGRGVVIVTMFVGRVGPLTLAFAFAKEARDSKIRYPEEKLLIG